MVLHGSIWHVCCVVVCSIYVRGEETHDRRPTDKEQKIGVSYGLHAQHLTTRSSRLRVREKYRILAKRIRHVEYYYF